MADPLVELAELQADITPLWGVVERVESGIVHFCLVGFRGGAPSVARRKFASVGTLSVGDRIAVIQFGQSGWVIMDRIIPV